MEYVRSSVWNLELTSDPLTDPQPILEQYVNLDDTCGVHNLHGKLLARAPPPMRMPAGNGIGLSLCPYYPDSDTFAFYILATFERNDEQSL